MGAGIVGGNTDLNARFARRGGGGFVLIGKKAPHRLAADLAIPDKKTKIWCVSSSI